MHLEQRRVSDVASIPVSLFLMQRCHMDWFRRCMLGCRPCLLLPWIGIAGACPGAVPCLLLLIGRCGCKVGCRPLPAERLRVFL